MNAISENKTISVTVGFVLLILAGAWKASGIVAEFEGQIRELQNKVAVLESRDMGPVWTAMRNQKEELEAEIKGARVLVEHQIEDLNGDVLKIADRMDDEMAFHHHHGGTK